MANVAFTIEIPEETLAGVEKRLLDITTTIAGPNKTKITKPVFENFEAWLKEVVGNNVAQLAPPAPDDPEMLAFHTQLESLQQQMRSKQNKVVVTRG